MKKSKNILLFGSLAFIIVGIIMIVVALLLGAEFTNYKLKSFNQTYEANINKININVEAGEVIIKESNSFKIEATNIVESKFKSEIVDDTWEIEHLQLRYLFNSLKFSTNSKIIIYIPKDIMIEEFSINIGAGQGEIERLNVKDIKIKVGAGELNIDNLYSEKSNIKCGVGEINIKGEMIGYNKIDNGVGSINLNLIGKEKDYNFRYEVGLGEVKINNTTYSNENFLNNNAINDFDINCGVGSIDINIKE